MLSALEIHDLPIIDRLEIAFRPGLNVLTGETGAGKSILLGALGFALGWPVRSGMIRDGAARGEVAATFSLEPDHPARCVLSHAGLPESDEVIFRRVSVRGGRNTAYVNDRRVSGEVLRALSEKLMEIHGQHDDRGLLDQRRHRNLLDTFARVDSLLEETRRSWRALADAERDLAEAAAGLEEARTEADFLRHSLEELDDLAPRPGEEGELDRRRRLMRSAERIRGDITKAYEVIGRNGAEGMITDALRWLEGVTDQADGGLDGPIAALSNALTELGEAENGIAGVIEALSADPAGLERVEGRLFGIRAVARKHRIAPDDLTEFAEELRRRLFEVDAGEERLNDLNRARVAAQDRYGLVAKTLSERRAEAAAALDGAMRRELGPLKMERASFRTAIAPVDPGPQGNDAVTFTVSANPGAEPGPIQRIASGGELSRFLLALKVCLTRGATGLTMIFDEIDRGVGGATADAVGRRLAALATDAQVLVVTHSPQIAARARHHWLVAKRVEGDMTYSGVSSIDGVMRVDELARMLAGDTITVQAREAAKALLAG